MCVLRLSGGRSKSTGGGDGGKADQSHKHVSRRRPALPCRRHRHHFCCGTTAYAFAECRLAVVTGWVAITRSVPPTHRQSPDIPRNAGPIQLAAPPQSECIPSSRIAPRPSAFRRAATNRAPPLSNHEELRFDKGSRQRAHWAGPSPSSADETCKFELARLGVIDSPKARI